MKKFAWYRSIRFQIPIILCITIILPLIILWQSNYASMNEITLEKANTAIQSDLSNKALSIDYLLDEVVQFAVEQANDSEIRQLITDFISASGEEKSVIRSKLTIILFQRLLKNSSISSVYVVIEGEGLVISTMTGRKEIPTDSALGMEIYGTYTNQYINRMTWASSYTEQGSGEDSLSYYRPVNLEAPGRPACSIICNADMQYFDSLIGSLAFENSDIVICDFMGNTMLASGNVEAANISNSGLYRQVFDSRDRSGSYIIEEGGSDRLVEYYSSMSTMWKYIETVGLDTVLGTASAQRANMFVLLLIVIVVALFGSYVISRLVLSPANRMLDTMKKTEKGNFSPVKGKVPKNEMGVMIDGYNSMVERLEALIENVYVQELLRREAQLRSLQSQMDEHFLYNTLNTVFCVIERGDVEMAKDMLLMLTRFFRLNLSAGRHYLKVKEVVELINCYLWIQKARYGGRLRTKVTVDESLDEYYVIKYLFQPIVENAIIHGLESKIDEGRVEILFKKQGDMLLFTVTDNGVGMDKKRLEELDFSMNEPGKAKKKAYALQNINEQIRLAYGGGYGVKIESEEHVGTKVYFTIPLKEDVENG